MREVTVEDLASGNAGIKLTIIILARLDKCIFIIIKIFDSQKVASTFGRGLGKGLNENSRMASPKDHNEIILRRELLKTFTNFLVKNNIITLISLRSFVLSRPFCMREIKKQKNIKKAKTAGENVKKNI